MLKIITENQIKKYENKVKLYFSMLCSYFNVPLIKVNFNYKDLGAFKNKDGNLSFVINIENLFYLYDDKKSLADGSKVKSFNEYLIKVCIHEIKHYQDYLKYGNIFYKLYAVDERKYEKGKIKYHEIKFEKDANEQAKKEFKKAYYFIKNILQEA